MKDQGLTTNGTAADGQATDACGCCGNRRAGVLADTATGGHGGGDQGRGPVHRGIGNGHGRVSRALDQRDRGQGRGQGGRDRGGAGCNGGLVGHGHEFVHAGTLLRAVGGAEIHNVLFAEHAPVRVHCELLLLWVMRRDEKVLGLTRTRINQGTRDQWTRREVVKGKREKEEEKEQTASSSQDIFIPLYLLLCHHKNTNTICVYVRGLDLGSFF